MKPCDSDVINDPVKKATSHGRLCLIGALARNSKATPRRINPISITATGR